MTNPILSDLLAMQEQITSGKPPLIVGVCCGPHVHAVLKERLVGGQADQFSSYGAWLWPGVPIAVDPGMAAIDHVLVYYSREEWNKLLDRLNSGKAIVL